MTGETMPPGGQQESLYHFVTRVAQGASDRQLLMILAGAAGIIVAVSLTGLERWPVAALAGTAVTIALWALIAHHPAASHPRVTSVVEGLLVVIGFITAIGAAFGVLLWILGPSWQL